MVTHAIEIKSVEINRNNVIDIVINQNTDFSELARLLASATEEIWPSTDPRWDPNPNPLIGVYCEIRETEFADTLSNAVAVCLSDQDPDVRFVVLCFFSKFPNASGGKTVLEVLHDEKKRLKLLQDMPPHDDSEEGWEKYADFRSRAQLLQNTWKDSELSRLAEKIKGT